MEDWDEARRERFDRIVYGRFGTPTSFAFEEAMAGLEGGVEYRDPPLPHEEEHDAESDDASDELFGGRKQQGGAAGLLATFLRDRLNLLEEVIRPGQQHVHGWHFLSEEEEHEPDEG